MNTKRFQRQNAAIHQAFAFYSEAIDNALKTDEVEPIARIASRVAVALLERRFGGARLAVLIYHDEAFEKLLLQGRHLFMKMTKRMERYAPYYGEDVVEAMMTRKALDRALKDFMFDTELKNRLSHYVM